jgi:hypothetical protein
MYSQLVNDFRVNDDTTAYAQNDARVGVDERGNFVIVIEDNRRGGNSNIYCQRFDSSANRVGNNFLINNNLDTASAPRIAVRKDGSFGVCWYETNSNVPNRKRIKFRIFSFNGIPISDELVVNDANAITTPNSKSDISCDSTGNFIIALRYNNDIYYQKIDKFGNKVSNNQKVNDDVGSYEQDNPRVSVKTDGSFIITWQDQRPPVPMDGMDDIYMQLYNSDGVKIGNNVKVNDVFYQEDGEHNPIISTDTTGAFCIGFTRSNFTPNTFNSVIQLFDKNGVKIGNNVNIANGLTGTNIKAISKRNNGDMVIGFGYDNGFRWRGYFERRKLSGELLPGMFQATSQNNNADNGYLDVAFYKDKIINLIVDNRNGNADIFCNIRSFVNPDSVVNGVSQIGITKSDKFKLHQNYPNPFNSSTIINYQLTVTGKIKIIIIDILGKEVLTLTDRQQNPGNYSVILNSNGLQSGLYFYSLYIDEVFKETKKFIIIK